MFKKEKTGIEQLHDRLLAAESNEACDGAYQEILQEQAGGIAIYEPGEDLPFTPKVRDNLVDEVHKQMHGEQFMKVLREVLAEVYYVAEEPLDE